ncbi:MAG: hypothetical protein ACUVXD_03360 [Thermodesulfobacteriota bacterium]
MVCAVVVDVFRLGMYGFSFHSGQFRIIKAAVHNRVGAAALAAFAGALVRTPLTEKVTMRFVQATVGIMLLMVAGG